MPRLLPALWLAVAALVLSGCGGYATTSDTFRRSLTQGKPDSALAAVNKAMEVPRAEDLPKSKTDTPLLLLERATILQAMGRHDLSSRDFEAADKQLEVLDFTSDTAGDLGKYLYSDDAQVYRAPPYEKLLVNTLNEVNYLVRGDLSGAKVEARRYLVNREYFANKEADERGLVALGSYLAGFAFEVDGDAQAAMRHYGDAYEEGGVPGLEGVVQRLAARTGAQDERLKPLLEALPILPEDDAQQGEMLVVVQVGMAPYRKPERLPIGAAVVYASQPGPGARLTPEQQNQANIFAAKGLLKWVNYPRLVRANRFDPPPTTLELNDAIPVAVPEALNVEVRVEEAFKRIEGGLIAAAVVRLVTRAIAGEVTQAAARKASGSGGVGLLLGLIAEGTLTALDTPDTRSWVTLPARFDVYRARVPAGTHRVRVRTAGVTREATAQVAPGGWAVVNISDVR